MSGSSIRRLGRDTMVYAIGTVLARTLSLVMLPIYTRNLTPADYGVLQLLEMTVDVGTLLIVAGMTAGLQKFYFEAGSDTERKDLVASAFALEMGLGLVTTAMLLVAAPLIWTHFLKGAGEVSFIQIAAVNFSLSLMSAVPLQWLQIERRSLAYVSLILAKLIAQIALNLYFVVALHWGVAGILATSFITNGLLGAGLAVWMLARTGLRLRLPAMRALRRFGLPYQATFFGSFVMTFGDRYFLQANQGESEVGLYSLAYSFGFLLAQLTSGPFLAAWNPQRFEDASLPPEARDPRYRRAFHFFNVGLIVAATAIALGIGPGLRIIAAPAFQSATAFVPIVLLAYVLQSWTEAVKFGIDLAGQTRYVSYAAWISMVLTLVLYATLIPHWGGFGAAWATVAGFGLRFALVYHWAQRLRRLPYDWVQPARMLALGGVVTLAAIALPRLHLALQSAVHLALFAAFVTVVWFRVVSPEDRSALVGIVASRVRGFRAARG